LREYQILVGSIRIKGNGEDMKREITVDIICGSCKEPTKDIFATWHPDNAYLVHMISGVDSLPLNERRQHQCDENCSWDKYSDEQIAEWYRGLGVDCDYCSQARMDGEVMDALYHEAMVLSPDI
jgi:hypothetical protein